MAFPTDWKYKVAITIESTDIDSDLSDWTLIFDQAFDSVLTQINGPLDADGSRSAIDGGGDIRFSSDEDGLTRLAVDVRDFTIDNTPASATCEVAVKVSSVSSSIDTTIYMWWGKVGEVQPGVSTTYGQYNAYDNDYVLVLPFSEAQSAATDNYKDRTSGQHHGTETASPVITSVSGKVGNAVHAADNIGDFGRISVPSFSDVESMTALSVEATVRRTSSAGDLFNEIIRKGTLGAWFLLDNDTDNYRFSKNGDNSEYTGGGSPATIDSWFHLCGTGTSLVTRLYTDGVSTQNVNFSGIGTNTDAIDITNYAGGTQQFLGDIEEVRISKVARTEAWAKANYNNIFNNSGFLTWGSIENITTGFAHSFSVIIG